MNYNYSVEDKLSFQSKDQRISFLAIFRDLCVFYKDDKLPILEIAERAKAVVEWEFKQWPLQEIKDEPFPTINRAPVKDMIPSHCPECGADVKHKSGVSKAGKGYDFYGCAAFPECHWTFKTQK